MIGTPYDDFANFVDETLTGTAMNRGMYIKTIEINRYFTEIVKRLCSEGYILDDRITYNLQFNIERDKENPNGINLNPMNDVTRETLQLLIDLQESDEARIERRTW